MQLNNRTFFDFDSTTGAIASLRCGEKEFLLAGAGHDLFTLRFRNATGKPVFPIRPARGPSPLARKPRSGRFPVPEGFPGKQQYPLVGESLCQPGQGIGYLNIFGSNLFNDLVNHTGVA